MTIIQLQYLIEVANCGSFSGASERCFVTQPSLSMQIKALEDELGVVLLDRSKKPVIPTDAGNVVIAQAQETLRAYNYIRESVAELKGETSGKLRLGVIPTIAPYLLHKFIPDFVKEFPRVELEIREMITADIIEALKHDNIDAAIVASACMTLNAPGTRRCICATGLPARAKSNSAQPVSSYRRFSGRHWLSCPRP